MIEKPREKIEIRTFHALKHSKEDQKASLTENPNEMIEKPLEITEIRTSPCKRDP